MASDNEGQAKSEITPERKAAMESLGAVNLESRREQEAAMYENFVKNLKPLSPELEEYWIEIPTSSGWMSKTKIIKPKNPSSSPLIVLFYGGAFLGGHASQLTTPGRDFAEEFGACVALPSYRLCPEVIFPVPQQDGYDVVRWLSINAEKELGADLSAGFIVGGSSAGGTIASAIGGINTNAQSRDVGKQIPNLAKPITGLYLSAAQIFTEETIPTEYRSIWTSRDDNKDVPPLSAAALANIITILQPDPKSPWFSPIVPLSWSSDSYPPTYFHVGGLDIARDDAVVFEKILSKRGIRTKIDVFPDDPHSGWSVIPYEYKSNSPAMPEAAMSGMKWLLQK